MISFLNNKKIKNKILHKKNYKKDMIKYFNKVLNLKKKNN